MIKIVCIYIFMFFNFLTALQKDGAAPLDRNRLNQPNRFMSSENRFKFCAKQSLPAQDATSQLVSNWPSEQSSTGTSDIIPKSIDDVMTLAQDGFAQIMSGKFDAEKQAVLLKQLQDARVAQASAFEREKSAFLTAHQKEIAVIEAQRAKFDEDHNAIMAKLNAVRTAQEIRHAQEREVQRITIEKQRAELAAQDAAFNQKLAALRAQNQLP